MSTVRIRFARHTDAPAIAELQERSVWRLNRADYTGAQLEAFLAHFGTFDAQLIADRTYLVAHVNGRLAGGGGWSRRSQGYGRTEGAPAAAVDPGDGPATIRSMFVDPDFARRGIGRALLAVAEWDARRCGFHRAELVATRTGEPLYRAAGYRVCERTAIAVPGAPPLASTRMEKSLARETEARCA